MLPNKPMVPTATNQLDDAAPQAAPPSSSLRRQTGQPFGIATAKRATCGIATVGGYERSVDNGIRAS